jgi:hypothetical protein
MRQHFTIQQGEDHRAVRPVESHTVHEAIGTRREWLERLGGVSLHNEHERRPDDREPVCALH